MEKTKIISGLFWKFAERIGAQGTNLIVSIVLARLIAPEEYGVISLISIFITISNVFIESGLGSALIQKKDADDIDFSSVFYFNLIISILIYFLLFLLSPYVAKFYGNSQIEILLKVLGLTIIISGLKNIQSAYVSKKMIFQKFFVCTIIGTIISAIIGIVMAYKGCGVWALVIQQLTNNTIDTIMLWILVEWKPKLLFSFKRLKNLIKYGWNLLVSVLIDTVYSELNGLVIGRVYKSESLAYYNKANQIPNLLVNNINASLSSVLFPVLSREQENKENIKKIMKKSIKLGSFILVPMLLGIVAVSEPLIEVLLTSKWNNCAVYMKILCVSYVFYPIHINNLEALKSIGRSDIYLKLEIIKKLIGIILLLCSIPFGILAMVISVLINSIICIFINTYPNKKIFSYGAFEQIKDVLPIFIIATIMAIAVYYFNISNISLAMLLILKILLGIFIYISLACFLKLESFKEIIQIIKSYLKGV